MNNTPTIREARPPRRERKSFEPYLDLSTVVRSMRFGPPMAITIAAFDAIAGGRYIETERGRSPWAMLPLVEGIMLEVPPHDFRSEAPLRFRCPVVTAGHRTDIELLLWTVPVTRPNHCQSWCFVDLAFVSACHPYGVTEHGLRLQDEPEQLTFPVCAYEGPPSVFDGPEVED